MTMKPDKPYNFSEGTIKRSTDFGTANKAAALIRKVLHADTHEFWDKTFFKRLKTLAVEIINMGPPENKGSLQFTDGYLKKLTTFEFNPKRKVTALIDVSPDVRLEKTEYLTIRIPKFDPAKCVKHPKYATSVGIRFVCGIFHFDLEKAGSANLKDIDIPFNKPFNGGKVKIPLQSAETSVVCVAMCVWCKKNGSKIARPPRWFAGNITDVFYIVDGKVTGYTPSPGALKKFKPDIKEKKEGLDWEFDEP